MDAAGNFYGTTLSGGASGFGTVFKVDSSGTETVLYSFRGFDGASPFAGLIRDATGNLYGTTEFGGSCSLGTVFKLDPSGKETLLHSFVGPPTDGSVPRGGLVMDTAGNLYGTTRFGGASGKVNEGNSGFGIVFRVDSSATESEVHNFTGPDGALPLAGLTTDAAGNFYGTTSFGGSTTGQGTVFKLEPSGAESVLYSFLDFAVSPADGAVPASDLITDAKGNFYGTTLEGGRFGPGTVFKLEPSGIETVLHSFSDVPDGNEPIAGLVMDPAGNLFGTTFLGGTDAGGTVFKVDPSGTEVVLHSFQGAFFTPDGRGPVGGLVMDTSGNLYGTTCCGGSSENGTIFKLSDPVTFASLIDLVNQVVAKPRVAVRMVAKLKGAEAMVSRGNDKSADRKLEAFMRQVSAQSGKSLTPSQATMLIQQAKTLMT